MAIFRIKSISTTDNLWHKAKIVAKAKNTTISGLFNDYIATEYSKLMKIPMAEELLKEMSNEQGRIQKI